jgi:protocatechuate 3,4-dioxygenase beta subunit
MALVETPWIGRRQIVLGLAAAASSLPIPRAAGITTTGRVPTPQQTEGPFYPVDWSGDVDRDLVLVRGEAATALGQVLHVQGRVLDLSGDAVGGAAIEIWQCDANGVYRHPEDERTGRRRDPGFQGRGRTVTDAAGRYQFRTIRPVSYGWRTPHIHYKVQPPKRGELITQMYVLGEPLNVRDEVLNGIRNPRQRDCVIIRLDAADRIEPGALVGTFDIVLG